ncbi:M28 family peptidase [Pedobacter nanyangensis]|uniref:M28 family peptidase n=1 Tax=Pedobacter nanyangensis TaxID=1562389 RepID=UPI000DE29851|nr:M28 family peptidase [Pedobacter nanyangensis]
MNKKFVYTSLALALSFGAMAQDKNAIKFSAPVNKDRAYQHLSILASDEYEGRETGKKGAWMAADYIKKQFQSFGLTGPVKGSADPYFQKVGLVTYDITQSALSINGKPQAAKDFIIANSSVGMNGLNLSANEIVFAGYGLTKEGYNDLEGVNVEGKVVMVFSAGDPTAKAPEGQAQNPRAAMQARAKMIGNLVKNKAKAILLINVNFDNVPDYEKAAAANGRIMLKNEATAKALQKPITYTSITISPAVANEIFKAANTTVEAVAKKISETGKPASQAINVSIVANAQKKEVEHRGENVLGFLEGSDAKLKHEVLVVTGHYDHIGLELNPNAPDKVNNGADDDGSGTTGVLMLAEAFAKAKKAGKGPKRSILFMTVVGEEKGLLGSEWYSENPVFPIANTITNLNIDMIGRGDDGRPGDNNFVYIIGSNMLSDDLDRIGKKANADYVNIVLDEKYNNRTDPNQFYYRSDHYNFAKFGIPVIFYFNGVHKDYHQPGDEVSKIDFPMLAKRAQLVYYTAWELANAEKRPVVNKNEDGTPKTN